MSARGVGLPDILMERGELSATGRVDRNVLDKYARPELPVVDEWAVRDVDGASVGFPFGLVERRYAQGSTVVGTQYAPA